MWTLPKKEEASTNWISLLSPNVDNFKLKKLGSSSCYAIEYKVDSNKENVDELDNWVLYSRWTRLFVSIFTRASIFPQVPTDEDKNSLN